MPDSRLIRIAIVEDHTLLRGALAKTLSVQPDFVISAECGGVDSAVEVVAKTEVDIVLLDINLGSEQGGAFLNRARAQGYRGKILVVTAGVSDREAAWLLNRGCSGIFLKSEPLTSLIGRIRDIVRGTGDLDAGLVKAVLANYKTEAQGLRKRLTSGEKRVLRRVSEGLTNKEIAAQMEISENTVKSFLQQLFMKTGARTRARLVAIAIEQYWDQLDGG